MKNAPQIEPATREKWRAWLAENAEIASGAWLVLPKKATEKRTFSFDEAVEDALCFGWIDSLPRKLDEARSMLYLTPRKPKSGWSRVNKERIERMREAGKMTALGEAKIAAAQRDGSWEKLDAIENLELPDDLRAAFSQNEKARENWEAFPRSIKRGILEWILSAKTEKTRARRIEKTLGEAGQNRRANSFERQTEAP